MGSVMRVFEAAFDKEDAVDLGVVGLANCELNLELTVMKGVLCFLSLDVDLASLHVQSNELIIGNTST